MIIRSVTMNPKHALKILNNNSHNRAIRKRKVEAYARDMLAGKWDVNGETIKIANDGTLIDGQHRLLAVVQADVEVPMVVVSDLPLAVQATVDTGSKRAFSDQLALEDVKYATSVAAITRRLVMAESGQMYAGGMLQPTEQEMRAYLDKHFDIIAEAAEMAAHVNREFPGGIPAKSVTGFVYVLCARKNKQQAKDFFEGLATGEGLISGSPVLALRRKYQRMMAEGGPQNANENQAYMIQAWNLYRKGIAVSKMQAPRGGWQGNFPKPE